MIFQDEIQLSAFIQVAAAQGEKLLIEADAVESERLLPALGEDLYRLVQDLANDAVAEPTEKQTELLRLCRQAVAPFMVVRALPLLTPALTNNGLMVKEAGENTRGAFQWEYREVLEAQNARGYAAIEALLRFLRNNEADFPDFAEAPVNDPDRFQIIRDGSELARCLAVVQPHRVYMALLPFFQTVADLYLTALLTIQEYEALTLRILADDLSDTDRTLLSFLRPAAARAAMKHAAGELAVQFSTNGFTIVDKIADAPEAGRRGATAQQLERFVAEMQRTSDAYFERARIYLNTVASVDRYPTYFESSLYTLTQPTDDPERTLYDTSSRNSFRM